jgi:hypothetical protein
MKKILILASNPRKDLNLDREIRDLKKVIERSKNQALFEVEIELAVRPEDLHDLFLAHEPRIVYFCGHGTGEQGLVLENNAGREQFVSTSALSSLFEWFDDKVECVWIQGVLENSLQTNALLRLNLEERPDAVQRLFEGVEDLPVEADDSFEELQATEIFEQMGTGKTLLILGAPGAGKTIALLKLAQRLVDQAEQDPNQQIPVVFNLSSWAVQRQSIAEWLVAELEHHYQDSQSLGKILVAQEQLILLLDGLDEVPSADRNACVRALNEFIATHGVTDIAICSSASVSLASGDARALLQMVSRFAL